GAKPSADGLRETRPGAGSRRRLTRPLGPTGRGRGRPSQCSGKGRRGGSAATICTPGETRVRAGAKAPGFLTGLRRRRGPLPTLLPRLRPSRIAGAVPVAQEKTVKTASLDVGWDCVRKCEGAPPRPATELWDFSVPPPKNPTVAGTWPLPVS